MQYLEFNEDKQRGTYDFPFEFHHIDSTHPQYNMSYHWHLEFELIRILSGEFKVTIDNTTIIAHENDTIFINGGTLHSGIPYNCVYECIVFDLNTFLKHNPSCKTLINNISDHSIMVYSYYPYQSFIDIHNLIWPIFDSIKSKPIAYQLTMFGNFYNLFGIIYQRKYYLEDSPKKNHSYKRIAQLKKVLELIENSYTKQLSLKEMADAADMSSKYFCKFFMEMTHKRPIDYLNYHRIEHACFQLSTTNYPITEIAYNCGFNDLSYFIKTFKKYKGVTPGKYIS